MRHQEISKTTSIPQYKVSEFIGKGGMNIQQTTKYLSLSNISVDKNSSVNRKTPVEVSGYPANVHQAVSDIHYQFYDLLEGDILLAREVNINQDLDIIVDLPNVLKGVVVNIAEVAGNQIRTATRIVKDIHGLSGKEAKIPVADIRMLEDAGAKKDDFFTQKGDTGLSDFAQKLLKVTSKTDEEAEEKSPRKDGFFDVEMLPQITEKIALNPMQMKHFTAIIKENKQFLEDKFNVILEVGNEGIRITGSEICVQEAKEELEKLYEEEDFKSKETILDKEQMCHFIGKGKRNLKKLEKEFKVVFAVKNRRVEITGSEACVQKAKEYIENLYKDTVFEAEVAQEGFNYFEVQSPSGNSYSVKLGYSKRHELGRELKSGDVIKVALFNRGEIFEEVEFLKLVDKKPKEKAPKAAEAKPEIRTLKVKIVITEGESIVVGLPDGKSQMIRSVNPDGKLKEGMSIEVQATALENGDMALEILSPEEVAFNTEVFCRFPNFVILKMPYSHKNKKIAINPNSTIKDEDTVKIKATPVEVSSGLGGTFTSYEDIELIEPIRAKVLERGMGRIDIQIADGGKKTIKAPDMSKFKIGSVIKVLIYTINGEEEVEILEEDDIDFCGVEASREKLISLL